MRTLVAALTIMAPVAAIAVHHLEPGPVPINPNVTCHPTVEGEYAAVLVQFTISEGGAVLDPVVLESEPPGPHFEERALQQIKTWRYNPRIVEGEPVAQPEMRQWLYLPPDGGAACPHKPLRPRQKLEL